MDLDKPTPEKQHCQEEKRVQDLPEVFQHPESRQSWGKGQWKKEQVRGRNQEKTASWKSREMCKMCQEVKGTQVRELTAGFGHEAISGDLGG